ncbi:MAG TPA: aldo/keto reductase [Pyrinomonadaceae bacterium]|nr:aldo/keto reductase [Pyrinomonadaceae bacterium]
MEYRKLGSSDFEISRIGFGTWAAGGGDWTFALGPQDDMESIAAIRRSVELGINWIDTAPLYGLGHSEEIVARALEGMTDRPYVFTKCGMPWDANGRIFHSLRSDSIRRECEASLRRLRVDVIDLYQIHWNIPEEEVEEGLETVARLQQEGKIRYAGVSNFTVRQLTLARRIASPVSLQPPYSLLEREAEDEIIPFCKEHNIGVIIYSPMKSGLLSGKMTRERIAGFPSDDLRRSKPEFQEPQLSRNLDVVETLRTIAARHGVSVAEIAVAWTLHNPYVDAAIVGMRRPDHAETIVRAASVRLGPEDLSEILDVLAQDLAMLATSI